MPIPTDITAGTISISGSTVTGVGTSFLASDIRQGDLFIWIEGGAGQWSPIVQTVTSNTVLTLAEPWTGPTISGARYRLRYQWDSSRVSAQSRQLIEMLDNGNVLALAGLTGPGVPVFDGPHSMTVQPVSDFINGVAYNVQVDTLADRAAYDGQAAGFAVLVSDVGDGRSAVYSKASNTSGDWTDPAYITGPIGPLPGVEATVTTSAPGSTATVDEVPITGGVRLDFTLPAAEGFYNAGVYDADTAYTKDQVVRHNGSSFIALQAVPVGTSPSSAFPPVDTEFWQVLAARGADGLGTGDVVGPTSAGNNRVAAFDGGTGKVIKDSGHTIDDFRGQWKTDLFMGNGTQTSFTLTNDPGALLNCFVFIEGIEQQSNTLTLSGTTLSFSAPPPLTSVVGQPNIEVRYGLATVIGVPNDTSVSNPKIANDAVNARTLDAADAAAIRLKLGLSMGKLVNITFLTDQTVRSTTSTTSVAPANTFNYTPQSSTSSVLLLGNFYVETERTGSAGPSGIVSEFRYYTGTAYQFFQSSAQIYDTDNTLGTGTIRRNQMQHFVILDAAKKRSDVPSGTGQWAWTAYFSAISAGNTAKYRTQDFVVVEFEP